MAIEVRDANGPVPEPASFGAWSLSIKASEQCFRHLVSTQWPNSNLKWTYAGQSIRLWSPHHRPSLGSYL
jgi:hypothetical protein